MIRRKLKPKLAKQLWCVIANGGNNYLVAYALVTGARGGIV